MLDGLLHRLGQAGSRVPHTFDGKAGRLRELAERRPVLLLLDNAASAEQVRPLLPMTDGTVVLVTSRPRLELPGLAITLDVFDASESVELLRRSTDDAGPELAALADLAGHLPLALALVAGRIRDHPDWTLADHLDRLHESRRLLRLDGGIELVLRTAYERLAEPHGALLRVLSLPRGPDFDVYAAAALAGCDLPTARTLTGDLHRANLLRQREPGRYRLHDIMRVFAAGRAIDEDSARDRRAAVARLHDYLLAAAARAMDLVAPHQRAERPRIRPVPATPVHPLPAGPVRAGPRPHPLPPDDARRSGHRGLEGDARNQLGLIHAALGDFQRAVAEHTSALRLVTDAGWPQKQAEVLNDLGTTLAGRGDHAAALDRHRAALAIAEDLNATHERSRAEAGIAAATAALRAEPQRAR